MWTNGAQRQGELDNFVVEALIGAQD